MYHEWAMSEAATHANLPEYSVSEISGAIKRTMEDSFSFVRVRGEISGLKFHSSGHVYFDLKDEKAVLNAVIWRGVAQKLKMRPEQGAEVVCTGRVSTYQGSSRYQLIVEGLELAGAGALMALIEQRKKMLAAEGLFAEERKRSLPFLPQVVGVVTSPTGAVIRDIMHRLQERFPRRVILWPVAVQGEKAAAEVAAAIRGFNALKPGGPIPRPDVLIVGRGGGSMEDLMPFNEEEVVRAAAESEIPLISAVGHETDTTLIDFASDRRAPTPTAAAEMAVPVRAELLQQVMELERRNLRSFTRAMGERRTALAGLARALPRADQLFAQPRQRFDYAAERLGNALRQNVQEHRRGLIEVAALLRPRAIVARAEAGRERLEALDSRLMRATQNRLSELGKHLDGLGRVLEGVSYRAALQRGYAVVRGADGTIRRRAEAIEAGEHLTLTFADGERRATADPAGGASSKLAPGGTPPPKAKGGTKGGQGSLF